MKILHTADWHIGSFKGPEENGINLRGEDTIECLNELIRVAQKEQPDLILVSGDIFHQAEIWQGRSHKEVLKARSIILELSKNTKDIIVMRGTPNHDSEEAFLELKAHFEFIDNIHIVSDNKIVKLDNPDIFALYTPLSNPGIATISTLSSFTTSLSDIICILSMNSK